MNFRRTAYRLAMSFTLVTCAFPSLPAKGQQATPDWEGPIAAIVEVKIKRGRETEFEAVNRALVKAVRENEPGTAFYTFAYGDEHGRYVMMERYESWEARESHRASAHFRELFPKLKSFFAEPPVFRTLRVIE